MNELKDKKLKVRKSNVQKAYDTGKPEQKELIEKIFPGEFKPIIITDIIHNFGDVLHWHGIDENNFNVSNIGLEDDEVSYRQMKLISRCLNELKPGERLDPSKTWYQPAFNRNAGSGLASADYVTWTTDTGVGERLSFKSSTLAIYAGQTFTAIYKPFMLDLSTQNTTNE